MKNPFIKLGPTGDGREVWINLNNVTIIDNQDDAVKISFVGDAGHVAFSGTPIQTFMEKINTYIERQ